MHNSTPPTTIPCPDCHHPATVVGHFTAGGAENPSEFLRIRCTGLLTLLVQRSEITMPAGPAS